MSQLRRAVKDPRQARSGGGSSISRPRLRCLHCLPCLPCLPCLHIYPCVLRRVTEMTYSHDDAACFWGEDDRIATNEEIAALWAQVAADDPYRVMEPLIQAAINTKPLERDLTGVRVVSVPDMPEPVRAALSGPPRHRSGRLSRITRRLIRRWAR